MPITVYGASVSPFVRKVRVVMAEKKIPYGLENVNIFSPPDWFVKISPLKRIPVLRDTDFGPDATLPDSSVICAYLEKKHPTPALYPSDPFAFGRALWLEEYADTELANAAGMGLFRPVVLAQLSKKDPDTETAKKTIGERLPPIFDYLEKELDGRDHLVGNALTIADIAVSTHFCNMEHAGYRIESERWPALARLVAETHGRSSFAKCIEEEKPVFHRPLDLAVGERAR